MKRRLIDVDALLHEIKYSEKKPEINDGLDEVFWMEECIEKAPIVCVIDDEEIPDKKED